MTKSRGGKELPGHSGEIILLNAQGGIVFNGWQGEIKTKARAYGGARFIHWGGMFDLSERRHDLGHVEGVCGGYA